MQALLARTNSTSLGFAGIVKFQAAGQCPGDKLEEQRERLQQEQHKLHDQQEALSFVFVTPVPGSPCLIVIGVGPYCTQVRTYSSPPKYS